MFFFVRSFILLLWLTSCASAPRHENIIVNNDDDTWEHISCDAMVEPSENWQDLAVRTKVPAAILKRYNNSTKLYTGLRILVPARKLYIVKNGETTVGIAVKYGMTFSELISLNNLEPPYDLKYDQEIKIIEITTPSKAVVKKPSPPKNIIFNWPLVGKVIANFGLEKNGAQNDGIRVLSSLNSEVKTAAAGTIVYVGNEVGSHGNLIMIQHPGEWLSSYGNLGEITVEKGDNVKAGQIIGRLEKDQLYFSLRRESSSVNPLKYLKARKN